MPPLPKLPTTKRHSDIRTFEHFYIPPARPGRPSELLREAGRERSRVRVLCVLGVSKKFRASATLA